MLSDGNSQRLGTFRSLVLGVRTLRSSLVVVGRLNKEVGMRAEKAARCCRNCHYCLHKLSWQLANLSRPGEELGRDLSRLRAVFLHKIKRELPLPTAKHHLRPDPRPSPFLCRPQFMSRNQQLIRVFDPERLDAYQGGSENYSVVTVARQRIRPDKPWQALPALCAEGHVMAKLLDRSAGFPAAQDVPFRCLLEFDGDVGSAIDPGLAKPLYRGCRKGQPQQGIGLLLHAYLFCTIGRPSASRIISFEHPAQQMYFLGSSTAMARLSPLLSRPACAQDGQRATQFLPTWRRT
jgi:hypothetical protein